MIFVSLFQFRIFYEIVGVHMHNHVPSGIPRMKGTAYLDVGITSHTIHIFSGHAINLTAPESFTGVPFIKQSKNSLSPLEFFSEKVMRSHIQATLESLVHPSHLLLGFLSNTCHEDI